MMRKGVKKGKERRERQTQGFGERGEVGVGEGEGRDLRDGGELFGDGCGKDIARGSQGNGKKGFWKEKKIFRDFESEDKKEE